MNRGALPAECRKVGLRRERDDLPQRRIVEAALRARGSDEGKHEVTQFARRVQL